MPAKIQNAKGCPRCVFLALLKLTHMVAATLVFTVFLCYTPLMNITQTVKVPANHRLTIDVPREIPAGPVTLVYFPASPAAPAVAGETNRTLEDALRRAAEKAADPNRRPLSDFFGIISHDTYGDGVAYQRAIRDEWND